MQPSVVLLPTYNERENLLRLLPRLEALEDPVDVFIIDDASPDGTGRLADSLRRSYPHLSVLHRRGKEGLGRAYVHGFKVALREGYRRIVTMDADLSHSPEDVPRLLAALEGAEVAIGSRHVPGGGVEAWPLFRRALSRAGSLYARTLLRLPVQDATSGFRAYRAEALERLDLDAIESRGFVFQVEVLRRILDTCAHAVEVPILFRNRKAGHSKLDLGIICEAAMEVARLGFRTGFRKEQAVFAFRIGREFPAPEPEVTVVVPARPEARPPEALEAIRKIDYPSGELEVLVARGCSPSRQRNLAVREGTGDLILFLDDDSLPEPGILKVYAETFDHDPRVGAVGGPSVSCHGSRFQDVATLVLGEPWVMGRSASRYRPVGMVRVTDERELILCNLCVRREAFEDVGGFREDLYPNEENEFLERLRIKGWKLVYRPDAVVRRPQRGSLKDLLATVCRYGEGRAHQLACLASRVSVLRLGLVAVAFLSVVLMLVGTSTGSNLLALPALAYPVYLLALAVRLSRRSGAWMGIQGALLSGLVHGSYALGVLRGLLLKRPARTGGEVRIERHERSQARAKGAIA